MLHRNIQQQFESADELVQFGRRTVCLADRTRRMERRDQLHQVGQGVLCGPIVRRADMLALLSRQSRITQLHQQDSSFDLYVCDDRFEISLFDRLFGVSILHTFQITAQMRQQAQLVDHGSFS